MSSSSWPVDVAPAVRSLMPLYLLRQEITGPEPDVPALARRYQVSEQAMWIQLFDHKLVSPSMRR